MRHQAVPLQRHPPALLDRRLLRPRFQRLLPDGPQVVEHLLVEVGRQVGLREQQVEAAFPIGHRGSRRGQRESGAAEQLGDRASRDEGRDGHAPAPAPLAGVHSDGILGRYRKHAAV